MNLNVYDLAIAIGYAFLLAAFIFYAALIVVVVHRNVVRNRMFRDVILVERGNRWHMIHPCELKPGEIFIRCDWAHPVPAAKCKSVDYKTANDWAIVSEPVALMELKL